MVIGKRSGFVKLTRAAVEEMFDLCNDRYFDGKVEKPVVFETWTPHKDVLAMARPVWNVKKKCFHSALHVSRLYNWPVNMFRDTVVHEMIHLYIGDYKERMPFWKRLIWTFFRVSKWEHDHRFLAMMTDLNARFPELDLAVRNPAMKAYLKTPKTPTRTRPATQAPSICA